MYCQSSGGSKGSSSILADKTFLRLLVLASVAVGVAMACTCVTNMCTNIPADNQYYLTSFCDKQVACGSFSGNCNEYYAADYKRFGCNKVISCCKGSNCVNLKVIDGGPACWVEDGAKKPIVDASYSTCNHFTGHTSCGWGDKILITCKASFVTLPEALTPEALLEESRILGPCTLNSTTSTSRGDLPPCLADMS